MDKNTKQQAIFLLRKSGCKVTRPRLVILQRLLHQRNPTSAKELIENNPSVDSATIYRTLKTLKNKGIIQPIDLRHNHAHYELRQAKEHHHLICAQCGRIEDVERCNIASVETAVLKNSKYFSEIRQHSLEFFGICKSCQRKKE